MRPIIDGFNIEKGLLAQIGASYAGEGIGYMLSVQGEGQGQGQGQGQQWDSFMVVLSAGSLLIAVSTMFSVLADSLNSTFKSSDSILEKES